MQRQQTKGHFSSIKICQGLRYQHEIDKLATILYSESSMIVDLIGKDVNSSDYHDGPCLVRGNQVVWLLKCCNDESQQSLQEIQRIVGLSQTIVCIGLTNMIEAFVDKTFWLAQNTLVSAQGHHRLFFVKSIYREKEKENSLDIRYFESIEKVIPLLGGNCTALSKKMTVSDLVQVYECQESQDVGKVKAIFQKYDEIREKQYLKDKANHYIFDEAKTKSQIKNEISSLNIDQQTKKKLLWKTDQISKYRSWTDEDDISNSQKYNQLCFDELNDRLGYIVMFRYHSDWTRNSLQKLKGVFNKMGAHRNNSIVKQFQAKYLHMRNQLQKMIGMSSSSSSTELLKQMLAELDHFYEYHILVIDKDSSSGSLRYFKQEARYLWKYKNNVYKKIAAFVLLGGLTYFQQSYIGKFTLLILTMLTLALRC